LIFAKKQTLHETDHRQNKKNSTFLLESTHSCLEN
jgi:hypothetical protein